jgi:predicted nucleotidyltransferase
MYLDNYIKQIKILCKKHDVRYLFVFGSVLTDKFSESSDVDFLVDFKSREPFDYAENFFNLKFDLEALMKRPVDLLEEKALKNPFLRTAIDNSKSQIYAS